MNQPLCYVIAHASSRVIQDCIQSLDRHGWRFKIFQAVDGRSLTDQDWQRIGVKMSLTAGKLPKRPGAQGCWFSHFALWERAVDLDQPLVILEHDAMVQAAWPDGVDIEGCLLKLYRTAECKTKSGLGIWSKGSYAYTVTPYQAQQLIVRGREFGASPVDKHIISGSIPWRFLDHDLVRLHPRRGSSSTSGYR